MNKVSQFLNEVKSNPKEYSMGGAVIFVFIMSIISVCAWFTHVFVCLQDQLWGFLIAGAILFPIAIVHGIGVWFGAF